MSNKLLTDVAHIFAELEVSYNTADAIADELYRAGILENKDIIEWVELASNAPTGGECSCG